MFLNNSVFECCRMKLSAVLICLCLAVHFEAMRANYNSYYRLNSQMDENYLLTFDSQFPPSWNNFHFPQNSVFKYRVTAPLGHQIRAICDFKLNSCVENSFYFDPAGKFSNSYQYCYHQYAYLLKTTSNVFESRYVFKYPNYRFSQRFMNKNKFKCELKACECGRTNHFDAERIVNGTETSPNAYPFFAALTDVTDKWKHRVICGATLIANNWVLTAAHCVMDIDKGSLNNFNIIMGSHHINTPSKHERTIGIRRIVIHPSWDRATYDNDIALIELIAQVKFNDYVSPVCLPYYNNEAVNTRDNEPATVIGYGQKGINDFQTDVLNEVQLKIEPLQDCKNAYASFQQVTDNMMCTYESNKDACAHDSGGPLFVQRQGRSYQLGIVSWGKGCAEHKFPGVYTYIPKFLRWIKEVTNEDFCWS